MDQTQLSKSEFFVLGQLQNGSSYVYRIAQSSSKTWSSTLTERGTSNALEQLQSKGLVRYAGLEEGNLGPARRFWETTEEGTRTFIKEYGMRLKELVSFYPF